MFAKEYTRCSVSKDMIATFKHNKAMMNLPRPFKYTLIVTPAQKFDNPKGRL